MTAGDLRQKGYAIEVLLERGLERYRTGATTTALQLWDEALALDPDEPRALTYIDYVRQNWDEVDGCVDPPVPDVSGLVPNYAAEAISLRPGNVQASVAGQVDSAELEARRAEAAALEARIEAARAEAARLEAAVAAAHDAVPSMVHDAPTPRGTVDFKLGGVGGDGWGLAPESLIRKPGALGGSRPWSVAPASNENAATAEGGAATVDPIATLTSEMAAPADGAAAVAAVAVDGTDAATAQPGEPSVHDTLPSAPESLPVDLDLGAVGQGGAIGGLVTETDAAMAPAIAAVSPEDLATDPRIVVPTDEMVDAVAEAMADEPTGRRRSVTAALAAEAAEVARTVTPVMPGRTRTPVMALSDADFERELEDALTPEPDEPDEPGVSGAAPGTLSSVLAGDVIDGPAHAPAAAVAAGDDVGDAVPLATEDLLDDEDLDLPPPMVDVPPELALAVAGVSVAGPAEAAMRGDAVTTNATAADAVPADPARADAAPAMPAPPAPPAGADPFGEDRPTVWSPYPPAPLMSMAERVEQALAREADPFAEDRVTTSWQAPPASLVAATRPEARDPSTASATSPPVDPAAELAAQLMAEPAPVAAPALVAPGADSADQLERLTAPPPAADVDGDGSVFDRITSVLPVDHTELEPVAPPSLAAERGPSRPTPPPLPRITVPMAAARMTAPMPAAAVDLDLGDDIELAPRSGVGLGADPPIRVGARDAALTTDDVGPLERVVGRPTPPAVRIPPRAAPTVDPEEMSLEDTDILADDDGDGGAAAPAAPMSTRVPTLPLSASDLEPAPEPEAVVATSLARVSTRNLGPSAAVALASSADGDAAPAPPATPRTVTPILGASPSVPRTLTPAVAVLGLPSAEVRLSPTAKAEPIDIGAFDGPEPQTVTVDPPSLDMVPALADRGAVAPELLGDGEDPFDLPTAPITPLLDLPARTRTPTPRPVEPPARAPSTGAQTITLTNLAAAAAVAAAAAEDRISSQPTLDLTGRIAAPPSPGAIQPLPDPDDHGAAVEPDGDGAQAPAGARAKTLELLPPGASPLWVTSPPTEATYQADTADLTPRFPAPPQDVAAPVAVTTTMPGARDQIDTIDLGAPGPAREPERDPAVARRLEPAPAWQPPPLEPVSLADAVALADVARDAAGDPLGHLGPLGRGDEILAPDRGEHLGSRLSPAVLRGLGLTPMDEGATTDEPTRNGWPTGRRPAPPQASRVPEPREPGAAAAPPPGPLDLGLDPVSDELAAAASQLDHLAMQDLELPNPRPGMGTRTPGEVLLRSSAPEALAAALASELDRGAPTGESPDDRARRRITALLERASAAARAGEHPMSIAAIDLALSEAPDSAVAQKLVHRSRDIILDCYQRYFGDLARRPVPVGSLTELTGRPLDPRAAFLVSRMDGTLTYEEILDVAGMGRLEACRHLAQLLVRGIIRST